MNTADFDFHLPEELIAQTPLEKRDSSRLLIVDRKTGQFSDQHFDNIIDQLEPGDALVMNNTRVLPARLYGTKPETGGHVELLLLKNTQGDFWEVLAKPAKRLRVGARVSFGDGPRPLAAGNFQRLPAVRGRDLHVPALLLLGAAPGAGAAVPRHHGG